MREACSLQSFPATKRAIPGVPVLQENINILCIDDPMASGECIRAYCNIRGVIPYTDYPLHDLLLSNVDQLTMAPKAERVAKAVSSRTGDKNPFSKKEETLASVMEPSPGALARKSEPGATALPPRPRSRKHRRQADNGEYGEAFARMTRRNKRRAALKRTRAWVAETRKFLCDNGDGGDDETAETHRSVPKSDVTTNQASDDYIAGVYSEENINLYLKAVPTKIDDLPFGLVLATNPRLFDLVTRELKDDVHFFHYVRTEEREEEAVEGVFPSIEHGEYIGASISSASLDDHTSKRKHNALDL